MNDPFEHLISQWINAPGFDHQHNGFFRRPGSVHDSPRDSRAGHRLQFNGPSFQIDQ
jgi:hypothetical protein